MPLIVDIIPKCNDVIVKWKEPMRCHPVSMTQIRYTCQHLLNMTVDADFTCVNVTPISSNHGLSEARLCNVINASNKGLCVFQVQGNYEYEGNSFHKSSSCVVIDVDSYIRNIVKGTLILTGFVQFIIMSNAGMCINESTACPDSDQGSEFIPFFESNDASFPNILTYAQVANSKVPYLDYINYSNTICFNETHDKNLQQLVERCSNYNLSSVHGVCGDYQLLFRGKLVHVPQATQCGMPSQCQTGIISGCSQITLLTLNIIMTLGEGLKVIMLYCRMEC